jgi:hypothetical protein
VIDVCLLNFVQAFIEEGLTERRIGHSQVTFDGLEDTLTNWITREIPLFTRVQIEQQWKVVLRVFAYFFTIAF